MTTLEDVLKDFPDGDFFVLEPGGNFGDLLIYDGAEKLFERESHSYRPIRRRSIPSAALGYIRLGLRSLPFGASPSAVYIHGGGNFNEMWGDGVHLFELAARLYDCPIVVGPQSCQFEETDPRDIFADVDNRVEFVCRERYSLELMSPVEKEFDNVTLHLSQDTALYLEPSDYPAVEPVSEYILVALRTDKESANPAPDLPKNAEVVESDVSLEAESLNEFIETIARAEKVYTDRLHVALTASIFDTETVFYDNVYHKNCGVYEYSLADDPNVEFVYLRGGDEPTE